jgi:two-component system alkaline phosphatase synthesis response regulator PhoP
MSENNADTAEINHIGKVLVVDDDVAVLTLLSDALTDASYEVSTAQDGVHALRMAQAQSFDVLLTDLFMPNLDGIEVIQILRKQQPNLRIIAISGLCRGNFLEVAELLGANDTLLKPFSSSQLLASVRKVQHGCTRGPEIQQETTR